MKILELLSEGFRKITPEEESRAYAVFVVVKYKDGYAATTRDKGAEPIGLPGGKVDPGETPIQAAYRECKEEGWDVSKIGEVVASIMREGKPIVWFLGYGATPLENYKEKHRGIKPIKVSKEEISKYLNNGFIMFLESLKGGKADNIKNLEDIYGYWKKIKDIPNLKEILKKEINLGIKVEREHTSNSKEILEIVLDHLKEDFKYYSKLKKIHKD